MDGMGWTKDKVIGLFKGGGGGADVGASGLTEKLSSSATESAAVETTPGSDDDSDIVE